MDEADLGSKINSKKNTSGPITGKKRLLSPCRNGRQHRPAGASHDPCSSQASRQKSYLSVIPRDILALIAFIHFSPDPVLPPAGLLISSLL